MKKNILVFPCGSEIGLEIYRSLEHSIHFNLIGANSVADHGRFVYDNYVEGIPFCDDSLFLEELNKVISKFKIDFVYPTVDSVIARLGELTNKLSCEIVGSPAITTSICLSKKKTTEVLSGSIDMPLIFDGISDVKNYPVFLKPEIGHSGRHTKIAYSKEDVLYHLNDVPGCLIMEYLPGEEYTIDCFTNKERALLFSGARLRSRVSNGISVHTKEADNVTNAELGKLASIINDRLHLQGAWFFQVKRSSDGNWKVMEVAARLGGSSALFRAKGVNFASLTLWDRLGVNVDIIENHFEIEMDRALSSKFKIGIEYKTVYVDFDDTLHVSGKINTELIAFLFQCINKKKQLICITRHAKSINNALKALRLSEVFDEIIHLNNNELKSKFIRPGSIFIDDSFAERKDVYAHNIPVFSTDMVAALIK